MVIAGAKGFTKELFQVYYRDFSTESIHFFDNISEDHVKMIYGQFPIIRTNEELLKHLENVPAKVIKEISPNHD